MLVFHVYLKIVFFSGFLFKLGSKSAQLFSRALLTFDVDIFISHYTV